MYLFNKYIHPANFSFIQSLSDSTFTINNQSFTLSAEASQGDIYHLTLTNKERWKKNYCQSELKDLENPSSSLTGKSSSLDIDETGMMTMKNGEGSIVLQSVPGMSFGVCGQAWLMCFTFHEQMRFYGMGEKSTAFEKSGSTHLFWNTDLWADHCFEKLENNHVDPDYISVPYVIIKQENEYIGILIDNPYCSIISTGEFEVHQEHGQEQKTQKVLYCGAYNGLPSVYMIYGPTLKELTRKLQNLVGTVPLPPLWSLGFHQSRWGYGSLKDLNWLVENFEKHEFPVDGLWLDIDYMDEYRVFTFNQDNFTDPKKDISTIKSRGYHIVPIIDPGVKKEPGYSVYDSGKGADVFCKNPAMSDFTGIVWPGYTVFPDFSLPEACSWWKKQIGYFAQIGIKAAWLDMNEPATGAISCMDMLFNHGQDSHETFHNQYASLMAQASREGFEAVYPDERIFLLSRSGCTGSQKYAANWCGDNFSNYFHLALTIAKTLNLSLSGMPFNGHDVGGFGGSTCDQLMIDWVKASFLFPFFRNHTAANTHHQEPWSLSRETLRTTRTFTRLRYKLLPYLYNLFIDQNQKGDPIVRPLFYEFNDSHELPLDRVDDQFMIGPALMQAPFVKEGQNSRTTILPQSWWYQADKGKWINGAQVITLEKDRQTTPIFIRESSIIPMQKGVRTNNRNDLTDIEILICLSPEQGSTASYTYRCDDGISHNYKQGTQSEYIITASVDNDSLNVHINTVKENYKPVRFTCVTLMPYNKLLLKTDKQEQELYARLENVNHFGKSMIFFIWTD